MPHPEMDPTELEESWSDIRPPRVPRPEPEPPPLIEMRVGHVWMALHSGGREVAGAWYERQPVEVPEGSTMTFTATFGHPPAEVSVSEFALYSARTHGELLWRTPVDPPIVLRPGDTLSPSLTIHDLEGTPAEFCGWRHLLKLKGIVL